MANPRIIAGNAKNKKLEVPESARPMTDRIKQSIFDLLGDKVGGAKVADLFAGSGNLGIEALSRGAESASFIELNRGAADVIVQNLINTQFSNDSKVVNQKAESFLNQTHEEFDLIFIDPPFANARKFDPERLLKVMNIDSIAVLRVPVTGADIEFTKNFELLHSQRYGESMVYFLAKAL